MYCRLPVFKMRLFATAGRLLVMLGAPLSTGANSEPLILTEETALTADMAGNKEETK